MPPDYQWYTSVVPRSGREKQDGRRVRGSKQIRMARRQMRSSGYESSARMGRKPGPPGAVPRPVGRISVDRKTRRRDRYSDNSSCSDSDSGFSSSDASTTNWSDDEDSEDGIYEIFNSLQTGTLTTQGSETELVDEVEKSENQNRSQVLQPTVDREILDVVSSRYSVDNSHSGVMVWAGDPAMVGAEVTHISGPVNLTGNAEPQFRWIHHHSHSMTIDQFFGDTVKLPGLTEEDCKEIELIRQRVQKQATGSFVDRDGKKRRVVEPVVAVRKRNPGKDTGLEDVYLFLSMPFLLLENALQSRTGDYYFKALLESVYPSISRARELQQAVCQLPGTPPGACLHISSLWSLVVRDKFLITFSKSLSAKDLCGESINLHNELTGSPGTSQQSLQVYHEDELYAVPLEHCDTWFKFTRMFHWRTHQFDDIYQVFWKNREVQPERWDLVLKSAASQSNIVFVKEREKVINRQEPSRSLAMTTGEFPAGEGTPTRLPADQSLPGPASQTDTQTDTLKPSERGNSKKSDLETRNNPSLSMEMSAETYLEHFYVFRWMAVQGDKDPQQGYQPDEAQEREVKARPHVTIPDKTLEYYNQKVEAYLGNMYTSMHRQQKVKRRDPFGSCQPKSFSEACKSAACMTPKKGAKEDTIKMKKDFFYAAESAFQTFLPLEQQGAICSIYWGAVDKIMITNMDDRSIGIKSHLYRSLESFSSIAKKATQVRHQLSHGKGPDPLETKLPVHFIKAWFHLLSYILGVAGGSKSSAWHSEKRIDRFERALEEAYEAVLGDDWWERISRLRVVRPSGTAVLLVSRIMEDMTGENRNVKDTYWEYFKELQMQVNKDPFDRSHQTKLSSFLDEVKAVQQHLIEQRLIMDKILKTPFHGLKPHPFHELASHPRHQALQDALRLHDDKVRSFDSLRNSILRVVQFGNEQVAINKDRQEQAIYVFTIVTIVFLPLSTVSSIFGMNTTDIRDIEHSQWIFWAIAIPVTILVVLFSLLGAGIISFRGLGLKLNWTGNRSSSPSPPPNWPGHPPAQQFPPPIHVEYSPNWPGHPPGPLLQAVPPPPPPPRGQRPW